MPLFYEDSLGAKLAEKFMRRRTDPKRAREKPRAIEFIDDPEALERAERSVPRPRHDAGLRHRLGRLGDGLRSVEGKRNPRRCGAQRDADRDAARR